MFKTRSGSVEEVRSKLDTFRANLAFIIKFTIFLCIFGGGFYIYLSNRHLNWEAALSDLKLLKINFFNGVETELNFPWKLVFKFQVVIKVIGTSVVVSFLILSALANGAKFESNKTSNRHDYRLISSKELEKDLDKWKEKFDEKIKEIRKNKMNWEDWNELGTARGDKQRRLKFGKFIRVGKEKAIIPERASDSHHGLGGVTRVGKSQSINEMIEQYKNHDFSGAVLDYNGELFKKFGEPEDIILCPFDKRTTHYDLFSEPVMPEYIAQALVEQDTKAPFFSDNGRKLLSDFMSLSTNSNDLHNLILLDREEQVRILKKNNLASYQFLENPKTGGSDIVTTMTTNLKLLPYLNHWNPSGKPFSIAEWAQKGSPNWLYIIVPDVHLSILRPWLRLFVDLVITGSLMRQEHKVNRKTILIGDEICQLGMLPSLEKAVTNGARYNLSTILTWQSEAQIHEIYKEKAETILSNIRMRSIYNHGDSKGKKLAAAILGEEDVKEVYTNISASKGNASISDQTQEKQRYIVHPNELSRLSEMEYYLKLPFMRPTKVTGHIKEYKARNKAMDIAIPKPLLNGLQQLQMDMEHQRLIKTIC